jgi:hypothetical protein
MTVMPLDHTTIVARDFVADARRRAHTRMVAEDQAYRLLNGLPVWPAWPMGPVSGRTRSG